jgi:hypothetical protein
MTEGTRLTRLLDWLRDLRCSPDYGCLTGRLAHIPRPKRIEFGGDAKSGCGEHSQKSTLMAPGRAPVDARAERACLPVAGSIGFSIRSTLCRGL